MVKSFNFLRDKSQILSTKAQEELNPEANQGFFSVLSNLKMPISRNSRQKMPTKLSLKSYYKYRQWFVCIPIRMLR